MHMCPYVSFFCFVLLARPSLDTQGAHGLADIRHACYRCAHTWIVGCTIQIYMSVHVVCKCVAAATPLTHAGSCAVSEGRLRYQGSEAAPEAWQYVRLH